MNITIISLDKWGYNKYIAKELQNRGIKARHLDFYKLKYRYPSFLHKLLNFFTKNLFNYNFKRQHLNKVLLRLLSNQEKQDIILIIKGDDLSLSTIKKIRKNTDQLITFFNDSLDRYPRMKKIYPYFDKVYSFDSKDVAEYNFSFITNYIYFDIKTFDNENVEYNIFNIGSLDKRSKVLPQFVAYFKEHNIDYKLIAYDKGDNEELIETYDIEITKKTYPLKTIFSDFVSKSNILLDLQRPKQKGLSFRIFEAIGLQKKIITTNKDIANYDFYNPNNIAIVDSDNINIPETFFTTPYEEVKPEIVNKYHISSWVNEVFDLADNYKTA
ncbi:hypothetical protein [Aquimarina mytili]|uniref:Lipopolysaccharide core biosynthesis protein rfaS n=1 Tax=Aquimarina mytili TaxID=874423 RepID=A0A936ZQQ7_9FLAO|nr:hypothetical protein [Aquimarina mytili]MBL0682552.1 hypothetical protein [Aquimarina mytili]